MEVSEPGSSGSQETSSDQESSDVIVEVFAKNKSARARACGRVRGRGHGVRQPPLKKVSSHDSNCHTCIHV